MRKASVVQGEKWDVRLRNKSSFEDHLEKQNLSENRAGTSKVNSHINVKKKNGIKSPVNN